MTIPSLLSSIAQGYTPQQVVHWLIRNHKKFSKNIKSALSNGYTEDQILTYLTKGKYASHGQKNEMLRGMTPAETSSKIFNRGTNWGQVARGVGTAASLAAGAYGLARGIPAIAQGIGGLVNQIRGKGTPPPSGSGGAAARPTPTGGSLPGAGAPGAPPGGAARGGQPPISPPKPPDRQQADALLAQIPPEAREFITKKLAEGINLPIEEMLKLYQKEKRKSVLMQGIEKDAEKMESPPVQPAPVKMPPETLREEKKETTVALVPPLEEEKRKPLEESPAFKEFIQPYQEMARPKESGKEAKKKPEKGLIVSTPDGEVGEIEDVKVDNALVNEDGKLHKVKLSELQAPTESIIQTVSRLLEIPEIQKSAIINYWAYDPSDKELFVMFHNGETYKYDEVPEELEKELSEASVVPKTKGENEFGAWSQEDPNSRGATFIQKLISHPKYKRTAKGEAPNPYYRKLRKGYDYWSALRKK